jgi:uncharacterized repeat protein (TIGR01451 family)
MHGWSGRFILFALAMLCTLGVPHRLAAQTPSATVLSNRATYSYTDTSQTTQADFVGQSAALDVELIDPFGQILGCGGAPLNDYTGFSTALFYPNPGDPTQTEIGPRVALTSTEMPDAPGNGIAGGIAPNGENRNPFALSNAAGGTYNFLLDPNQGQIDVGQTYLLVITPPESSIYVQRRVKLEITGNSGGSNPVVSYRATSIDGQPIAASGATQVDGQSVQIANAEQAGLLFFSLQLSTTLCNPQQIQIVKSGDRAVAQPGDTVIYRVTVRNQTDGPVQNLTITDALPLGFHLLPQSVKAQIDGQEYPVQVVQTGANPVFQLDPTGQVGVKGILNLVYAVQLSPDAIRGTGRNAASVSAQRSDTGASVRDGPATYRMRIDPGLLSDCGTLLGRVFVDRNLDGEQQPGEPGIPNAVVFMDDGNRITTDADGLFSVANMLPGYRTGILDPLSVPGYRIAPNAYFIERNSPSRLVHLEPGGMVRMNFGVIPTHQGVDEP